MLFVAIFGLSLQNKEVNFSDLRFWRQREPAAENLSFFAFILRPFVPGENALRLFWTTWPTWNNRQTVSLTQSSTLKWRFCCSSRRSFLNVLLNHSVVHVGTLLCHSGLINTKFQLTEPSGGRKHITPNFQFLFAILLLLMPVSFLDTKQLGTMKI